MAEQYDDMAGSPQTTYDHPGTNFDNRVKMAEGGNVPSTPVEMNAGFARQDLENYMSNPPIRSDQFHDSGANIPGKLTGSNEKYFSDLNKQMNRLRGK